MGYTPDRSHDSRRQIADVHDHTPEEHENIARGAETYAAHLANMHEAYAAQGNLLHADAARRASDRMGQSAAWHLRRAETLRTHPSDWDHGDESRR
jgi:hypothetical protein